MADFLQQVVSGLASGGIYASLALALVVIYRATKVINFAQGEMAMLATFVAWALMERMPYWPAFVLTLAIAFLGGAVLELTLIRPVQNAPVLTVVIVTIGLFIGLNGLARRIWGTQPRTLESPFSTDPIRIGGVAFSVQDLGIIGVSLAIVALLFAFFRFTKLGLGLRASATNPAESRLVGIRVPWMLALGWGLAAVLGAVAGMMAAPPLGSFDQNLMQPILLYAFAAAVLGGVDSPIGAVAGGLALGVVVNLIGTYVDFVGADLRLPVALSDFRAQQLAFVAIYLVALLGLNVLIGFSGQVSLGHGAFMALGGYTTAILIAEFGVRDLWTIPLGGLVAGAAGLLFRLPGTRLTGAYLALATFGIAVALPAVIKKAEGWSGGSTG